MPKRRYRQAESGEWIQPVMTGYRARCCDCALVHILNFEIEDGRVLLQVIRDERKTAASRRERRKRRT